MLLLCDLIYETVSGYAVVMVVKCARLSFKLSFRAHYNIT